MKFQDYKNNIRLNTYLIELHDIMEQHPELGGRKLITKLANRLSDRCFPENKKQLLRLYSRDRVSQGELDAVLEKIDIEAMISEMSLMLAYMTKRFPELDFGSYNTPRLKGLLQYYKFQNLELTAHFAKIVKVLNSNNIVPMIIKGGAMRFLRPELPRIMADIDIIVQSREEWIQARTIIKELGYTYIEEGHSMDVHLPGDVDKGIMDIHWKFSFCKDDKYLSEVFGRAALSNINGRQCYLPSYEDMAFITLLNLAWNVQKDTSKMGIPFSVVDLYFLTTREGFDWDIVWNNVVKNDLLGGFYFAYCFYENVVPGLIPARLASRPELDEAIEKYVAYEKYKTRRAYSKLMTNYAYWRHSIRTAPVISGCEHLIKTYHIVRDNVEKGIEKRIKK